MLLLLLLLRADSHTAGSVASPTRSPTHQLAESPITADHPEGGCSDVDRSPCQDEGGDRREMPHPVISLRTIGRLRSCG